MLKLFTTSIFICLIILPLKAQNLARGADVGWLSEMEAAGRIWRDSNGVQQDLFDILPDYCINSIRLRVWVNPEGGWSGQQDVINLAKRAVSKGFRLMIDFHYSDSWADPGKQTKPAAWANYTVAQLVQAVHDHTQDVLTALKNENIIPEWVQVGNETNDGMLWPEGRASGNNNANMANYARFVDSGYEAVKKVFPSAKVIVHVSNGYDNNLFRWNIGGLISNNARFDVIAMSMYPGEGTPDWPEYASQALNNMQDLTNRYGKEVMVSEIGMPTNQPQAGRQFVEAVIKNLQSLPNNRGLGVFWWEPQAYNWRGYGKVAWNGSSGPNAYRATEAMKGFQYNCTASVNLPPRIDLTAPANNSVYTAPASITITATATDPDGTVGNVSFYNGNTLLATDNSAPYSYSWNNVPAGTYTISAQATDNSGATANSSSVTLTVNSKMVETTFSVDMTGQNIENGVYITGDMTTANGNWQILSMEHIGNQIYSRTISIPAGAEGAYYYLNDNNWTARETVPALCAVWWDIDRGYQIPDTDTYHISDRWSNCDQIVTSSVMPIQTDSRSVYPNPFDECLNMSFGTTFDYLVWSLSGQVIESGTCSQACQIGFDLQEGTYILEVVSDHAKSRIKIVKR